MMNVRLVDFKPITIEYNGETMSVKDFAKLLNRSETSLYRALRQFWPDGYNNASLYLRKALFLRREGLNKGNRIYERDGCLTAVNIIRNITGLSITAVHRRLIDWEEGLIDIDELLRPQDKIEMQKIKSHNRGSDEWIRLGSEPRNHNLKNIKVGKFERR
jgi:hypothetical protein